MLNRRSVNPGLRVRVSFVPPSLFPSSSVGRSAELLILMSHVRAVPGEPKTPLHFTVIKVGEWSLAITTDLVREIYHTASSQEHGKYPRLTIAGPYDSNV